MSDQGPYREPPRFLLCPRCGEMLDRVFDDVLACLRCRGIFITPPTSGLAFGDAAWPADAAAMWWKSSLECPVCAYHGAPTTMAAQSFEGTQIDRCASHGLWLDQGELNRLAGTRGDELAVLRRKLHGELDTEVLDAKREAWRRDVEARRKQAEAENERLAAERARLIAEADQREAEERAAIALADQRAAEERAAIEHERRQWTRPAPPRPVDPPAPPEPPARPAFLIPPPAAAPTWRELEAQRRDRGEQQRRDEERAEVVRAIGELEDQLTDLRRQVRFVESQLSVERARLRALAD